MNNYGHNESAVRLAALAGDAQVALDRVARGEADAIEGWLAYGAALNEGRALFAGDKEFSAWMAEWQLAIQVEAHERSAAMWAAANADQLAEAKAASKARTLRGWHEQWKKIEAKREADRQRAEREAEQARKREEAEAAKKIAEEQAKVEAEARAIATSATDEKERKAAEQKAAQAAAAKADAETLAAEIEAKIAPEPQEAEEPDGLPEDDEIDRKLRRAFRKLTPQAQEDEWVNLKRALHDEVKKRRAVEAENRKMKEQVRDLSESDSGAVIRRLTKTIEHKNSEMFRANEKADAAMRQVNKLKKRVAELEAVGIRLN